MAPYCPECGTDVDADADFCSTCGASLENALNAESPAVADDTIYVGSDDNHIYAVDAGDGTEVWSFDTGDYAYSPAVVDGVVYVVNYDGVLYAVE